MIHVAVPFPRIVSAHTSQFMMQPNEFVLIPWRLAALGLHVTALLAALDSRKDLIRASALPPEYEEEDYQYLLNSTNWAIAASFICLVVCSTGFFTGRTILNGALNLLHAVCHTVAGILLICMWYNEGHVVRIWHIMYFFALFPAAVETFCMIQSQLQGVDMW